MEFADTAAAPAAPARAQAWLAPEGIRSGVYTADALKGLSALDTYPGIAGPYRDDVLALDDPAYGFSAEVPNAFYRQSPPGKGLSIIRSPPTAATTPDHPRVSGDVGMAGVAIDTRSTTCARCSPAS